MISRRVLLGGGTVAALAGRAAPAWQMRLSTSTSMFNSLPVEQACARIASLGYEGVDIWQGEAFKTKHLDEAAERLGPAGLAELLRRNKLKLASFTVFYLPIGRYAEMLGRAGGPQAMLIRESRYYGSTGGKSGGATRTADPAEIRAQLRSVIGSLRPHLELAGKHDFKIAIENHSSAILNSLDSFRIFMDLIRDEPRIGIAVALYHLLRDKVPVEQVIAATAGRMLYFYAWQNEKGAGQLPGFGGADFTPWLAALAKVNYGGWVNVFMHGSLSGAGGIGEENSPYAMAEALAKSKRYLEDCRARI